MKYFVAVATIHLILLMVGSIAAVGPTLSANDWTPVPASQRVRLPPEVIARHRAEAEARKNNPNPIQNANERYDVVDIETEEVVQGGGGEVVAGVFVDANGEQQEIIVTQEAVEVEQPQVDPVEVVVEEEEEKEPEPIIIYPEGSLQQQQNQNRYETGPPQIHERPDVQYPSQPQQQPPHHHPQHQRPRLPLPPPPRRPPVRPRRPPPPYLPALSRNAPPPYPNNQERTQDGSIPIPPPIPQQRFEEQQQQQVRPRPPLPPPKHNERPPPPPPPPRRPRPPPRRRPGGVLVTLGGIANNIKCKAEDIAVDMQLDNEEYVRQQIDCVLGEGACDDLGGTLKRKFCKFLILFLILDLFLLILVMAPDILKGHCPSPCNQCKKAQIQKVMSNISRKYPKEWNKMIKKVQAQGKRR